MMTTCTCICDFALHPDRLARSIREHQLTAIGAPIASIGDGPIGQSAIVGFTDPKETVVRRRHVLIDVTDRYVLQSGGRIEVLLPVAAVERREDFVSKSGVQRATRVPFSPHPIHCIPPSHHLRGILCTHYTRSIAINRLATEQENCDTKYENFVSGVERANPSAFRVRKSKGET